MKMSLRRSPVLYWLAACIVRELRSRCRPMTGLDRPHVYCPGDHSANRTGLEANACKLMLVRRSFRESESLYVDSSING
jgi:hypothetical protein